MSSSKWKTSSSNKKEEEFFARLAEEYEREKLSFSFKNDFDEFWDKIENIGRHLRTPKYRKDVFFSLCLLTLFFFVGYLIGLAG